MFRPHPFSWVPAEGQRHASTDPRPAHGYPNDYVVATLCGRQLRADNSEVAWLWSTCGNCHRKARALAGQGSTPSGVRRGGRSRDG